MLGCCSGTLLIFGFAAASFAAAAARVLATSRTPYYSQAAAIGAEYFEDADDFCEEHPDVVILASSILSSEPVVRNLPLTRLKRSTLIVDVLSVKVNSLWLLLTDSSRCSKCCGFFVALLVHLAVSRLLPAQLM
jgi:prephenate dehydrogenase